jgi:hypothetical protein
MPALLRTGSLVLLLASLAAFPGCSSSSSDQPGRDKPAASTPKKAAAASKPFVLGDLIAPYDPPPLEELVK